MIKRPCPMCKTEMELVTIENIVPGLRCPKCGWVVSDSGD